MLKQVVPGSERESERGRCLQNGGEGADVMQPRVVPGEQSRQMPVGAQRNQDARRGWAADVSEHERLERGVLEVVDQLPFLQVREVDCGRLAYYSAIARVAQAGELKVLEIGTLLHGGEEPA